MYTTHCLLWITTIYLTLFVGRTLSTLSVDVSFVPVSPVPIGDTTFRCDFVLTPGDVLLQLSWNIVGVSKFYVYEPGKAPVIEPDYVDKVLSDDTDNTTYHELKFNVTPCDVGPIECTVLGDPSYKELQDQLNLQVRNIKPPILKINGTEPTSTEVVAKGTTTVSCSLNDAGPPQPRILSLRENDAVELSSNTSQQDNQNCMWSFNETAVQMDVFDNITETKTYRCHILYTDGTTNSSVELSISPDDNPFPWWGILLICLAVLIVIFAAVGYIFRDKIIKKFKGEKPEQSNAPANGMPLENKQP